MMHMLDDSALDDRRLPLARPMLSDAT